MEMPSPKRIRLTRHLLFIVESYNVGSEVEKKMTTLAPRFEGGMWVTNGTIRKRSPQDPRGG